MDRSKSGVASLRLLTINPFDTRDARASSAYYVPRSGALSSTSGIAPPPEAVQAHDAFRDFMFSATFPCIGGQSAVHQDMYRFGYYGELASPSATAGLAFDFFGFLREQPAKNGDLFTFIAVFDGPLIKDEAHFELLLWMQLLGLHELDREHFDWAPGVSSDPQSRRFAFSFAGQAFFLAGFSPVNRRRARRFQRPALVFNLHETFQSLRRQGVFQPMAEVIRDNEARCEGRRYRSLSAFGQHTDASQYAGREVTQDWRCPVRFS
jgi:FPC/CPF motif-containing protein YcgG